MPPLPPRRLAPALALSLLCLTLLVRAQTPATPHAGPQILLRVEYVMVNVDEANHLVPFSPSIKTEVQCLEGETADKIYHSLARSQGSFSQCPPAIATSREGAYFQLNTSPFGDLSALLPSDSFSVPIEAALAVTPRSNQASSVTLTFNALAWLKDRTIASWPRLPVTRTVRSGERLLLISLPIQQSDSTAAYKAFMFVTPTVLESKAAAADTGQPDPPMLGITDTPAEAKRLISFMSNDAELATIAGMLDQPMGVSIILRQGSTPFGKVHVRLINATPSQVLRALARSTGAVLTREPGGEYVFATLQKGPPGPQ